MRWVLSRRVPPPTRILLVESGPRTIAEGVIPRLREVFGSEVPIDLLTCLPTDPGNLHPAAGPGRGDVFRVIECPDQSSRWRLLRKIRARRHTIAAILCAGSPIMAPWKTAALVLFPAKFLIVNENSDFFWLDRGHWRAISQFLLHRTGLLEESAVRTVARLAAFPFTLAFLLAYAGGVHLVRLVRLALGLRRRSPSEEEELAPLGD